MAKMIAISQASGDVTKHAAVPTVGIALGAGGAKGVAHISISVIS